MRRRQPLLNIAVHDRRMMRGVLCAIIVWSVVAYSVTSVLRGSGIPFDYVAGSMSLGQLRFALWFGTAVMTSGVVALGWQFILIGFGLRRALSATGFGLSFSTPAGGFFPSLVRMYGGFLVVAGVMMLPLGTAFLFILATCRYMTSG